jgi:multiple sugar transport system substrate-binding protein
MPSRCRLHWPLRLIALLPLLLINSCDRDVPVGGEGVITLRFWNGFTGPDGRTMLRIVQRFNRENPHVHVVMQRIDWATYYNKLFVARLGGRGPDVFVLHTDSVPRFVYAGFLRPCDDLISDGGLDANDFDANVWQSVAFDGKHYAIPLDVHPLGMYYNRTLFKKAGIVDAAGNAKPPTNRQEFLHDCQRITNHEKGQWGFVFTWQRTNVFTVIRQFGGSIFSDDYARCTLTEPATVAGLQFCVDLIHKLRVAPTPAAMNPFIGFRQGKVGMVFEGIYMLPELQRQTDLDWAAAPLPQLGETKAAWGNSHNLCVSADAEGARLEACKRFVKYLSDHSLDWAEGGQVPVRRSLRDSERFRGMTAQFEFARQMPYIAYMPRVLFVNEYLAEFEPAVDSALRGSITPEQAMQRAQANIERIMRRFASASQVAAGATP